MNVRRVVVTGLGVITPVGNSKDEAWSAVREGRSGISPIESFDTSAFDVHFGGEVKDFDPLAYFTKRELGRLDRFVQFAVAVAEESVEEERIVVTPIQVLAVELHPTAQRKGRIGTPNLQRALIAVGGLLAAVEEATETDHTQVLAEPDAHVLAGVIVVRLVCVGLIEPVAVHHLEDEVTVFPGGVRSHEN